MYRWSFSLKYILIRWILLTKFTETDGEEIPASWSACEFASERVIVIPYRGYDSVEHINLVRFIIHLPIHTGMVHGRWVSLI